MGYHAFPPRDYNAERDGPRRPALTEDTFVRMALTALATHDGAGGVIRAPGVVTARLEAIYGPQGYVVATHPVHEGGATLVIALKQKPPLYHHDFAPKLPPTLPPKAACDAPPWGAQEAMGAQDQWGEER